MADAVLSAKRTKQKRIPPHPCTQCGTMTQRPKHCSWECGSLAHRRRKGERPIEIVNAERIARILAACPVCGKEFPAYSNRGGTRVCSVECRHVLRKRQGEQSRSYTQAKRDLAKWARPTYLSPTSRLATLRRWKARAEKPCTQCGEAVGWARTRTVPATFCSLECVQAGPAFRESKKAQRKKRKAAQRAVTVETVSPLKVFMRDGWLCHLCGGMTDKSKRGTMHPNAPELDHILPLARGGDHSYANTACAHKRCNAAKSDRIIGQPSLLAA